MSALICSRVARRSGWSGRADERDQAAVGQAGENSDEILFGDATLISRVGNLFAKATRSLAPTESLRTATIRSSVRARAVNSAERLAAAELGGSDENGGHWDIPSRAARTCSSEGTLWCHSTGFP